MRIFVAFGYNDRDAWVKNMVIPIMNHLGIDAATGETLGGQIITTGVRDRIKESDALIGFLTRRGMVHEDGTYSTHAWVQTELGAALGSELQYILEVRETDLEDQGNIVNDR